MGGLCAFELLRLLKKERYPMPSCVVIAAMVAPDLPHSERPWRRSSNLTDEELQEECRAWGSNEEIMNPEIWQVFGPLVRDDFKIFDEYNFEPDDVDGFGVDATIVLCGDDTRVTSSNVEGWRALLAGNSSDGKFLVTTIDDVGHAVMYDSKGRAKLMDIVITKLESLILEIEYG